MAEPYEDTPVSAETPPPSAKPALKKKVESAVVKKLKAAVKASRKRRRDYLPTWQDNVARRVNQPLTQDPSSDTVVVSTDWSRTKNKQAQLFFQCPTIRLTARHPSHASQAPLFAAAINFELDRIHAYAAIDECMADAINGSGLAAAIVGYTGTFEKTTIPNLDVSQYTPEQVQMQREAGSLQDKEVARPVYECYYIDRISPARLLWPSEFKGTDWTKAPWLGYEGYLPLAEAQRRGWVPDDFEGEEITADSLADDVNLIGAETLEPGLYVKFVMVFYYASQFDKSEPHPECIRRMVLIDGLETDEPAVDEKLAWQRYVEPVTTMGPDGKPKTVPGHYIGMTTLPIKVLTLTTISDLAIPPSDTEIGRAQVDELNAHRSMMVRERKTSVPIRWFDTNMLDGDVAELLRSGKQQDMIPINGPGERAIGEVARANYPRVNIEGMNVITRDLDESWSMSAAQQGTNASSETSAAEIKSTDSWATVRLEYERARTLRFALALAEGLGDLMQLFADAEEYVEVIGQDGVATLQAWDKTKIAGKYLFKAQPDSSVRVDINAKKAEFLNKYKLVRRDPLFNPQDLALEYCEIYGRDPAKALKPPEPPPKKEPTVRWSLKGEDVLNPIVLAHLQKSGIVVTAEEIAAAKKLIADSVVLAPPPMPGQPMAGQMAGQPMGGQPMPMAPGAMAPHPGGVEQVDPIGQRYGNKPQGEAEGSVN